MLRLSAVKFEQAREDFVVGRGGVEAVCGGDRRVELEVREVEPSGALVVEVRERAPCEFARGRGGCTESLFFLLPL